MHTPKLFKVEDFNLLIDFLKRHSFATVISAVNERPDATQVPVMIEVVEGVIHLYFHLANANPQVKALKGNDNVLVQFTGPHGYVSSSWYKEEEVSTWNYQTAHLRGSCEMLDEPALIQHLRQLTDYYEAPLDNGRTYETLSEDTLKQMKGITGFKVTINEAALKYKLSQNRSDEDYQNIVIKLKESRLSHEQALAYEMEKLREN